MGNVKFLVGILIVRLNVIGLIEMVNYGTIPPSLIKDRMRISEENQENLISNSIFPLRSWLRFKEFAL